MEKLLATGSIDEVALVLLLLSVAGFLLLTPFVWIGGKVLALRERPDRRAFITTAAAYGGASLFMVLGSDGLLSSLVAPLVPVPGALIVYLWLRRIYRAGWVEDDQVPEGMKLENSDWRVGLGIVVGAVSAAAIKVALLHS